MTDEEKAKLTPEELEAHEKEQSEGDDATEEEKLAEAVKAQLAPMKESMDRMARERDDAKKKLAKIEEQKRLDEIEALKDAGKSEEAFEAQLSDAMAKVEAQAKTIMELTRDQSLKEALGTLEGKTFKNQKARDFAFREIVEQLTQDEEGTWVHKTGVSIVEFVKKMSTDEGFDFLFDIPDNSGGNINNTSSTPNPGSGKKISEMSPAELIQAARNGKLGTKTL